MIYTSYFAQLKKIPEDIVRISICGKAPAFYKGIQYKKIAPKYDFFIKWKGNLNDEEYIKCFNEQILEKLDPHIIEKELYAISNNKDIVLLCYEKSSDFCHRHLISKWLRDNNIECKEWMPNE